jgi:hypothetical protein
MLQQLIYILKLSDITNEILSFILSFRLTKDTVRLVFSQIDRKANEHKSQNLAFKIEELIFPD